MLTHNKIHFVIWLLVSLPSIGLGQSTGANTEQTQDSPVSQDSQTIILRTGQSKPPPFLYAATAMADIRVGMKDIDQTIQLQLRIVQGDASRGETVSLGLSGSGDVIEVQGSSIASWSIRTAGSQRFLDLQLKPMAKNEDEGDKGEKREDGKPASDRTATIRIRSQHSELPIKVELAHLIPGKALGFASLIELQYEKGVSGKVVAAEGFAPLVSSQRIDRLQTSTGGRLELQLDRDNALAPAIELLDTNLVGDLDPTGKSVRFQLIGKATATEAGARVRVLSGRVAMSQLPESSDYRLELLNSEVGPVYELVFPKAGSFPIALDFVAAVKMDQANSHGIDFTVAASAVVPISLRGLATDIAFSGDQPAIVPLLLEKEWRGFLPATGHVLLRWQSAGNTVESKPFFTTSSSVDATVGPGLLRQEHRIEYQLLQGQLKSLSMQMVGPGEILNVEGERIVAWKVVGEGSSRQLDITLNQPLTSNSQVLIRSQASLGEFPVRAEGLSLRPQGAIRNSGHVRISNSGSVRVEPTALRGLTQLAPEQFPGEALQSRQLFVYRFPAADYGFTILADRVQPEVSIAQLVLYQLSESDRVIAADIELDIREAAIREWNLIIPFDYSIVSITGANVADYLASSEVTVSGRNVKVLFNQDVQGRQLIGLRLEKNEAATTGPWILPHILFPNAKAVRGDIGIVAAPGFRATVGTIDLLVEKPLSYFPRSVPNLQQAFRIREPGWSATLQIEQLERSVQSDAFHLISLSQGTVYGSALINYSVTGAPVAEWQLTVPAQLSNVTVDGQEIRNWRREGDILTVSLQQPILGAYTLLVTFEEKPNVADGAFQAGLVAPLGVQGDRGYVEVVSPVQVEMEPLLVSSQLLVLDPLELPAEFRLLSTAPALGTWQYTQRPFDLKLKVNWFDPGTTASQVVEFSEANSRVSKDGELVTDVLYYVKSRGQRTLKLQLPSEPVRLWAVSVNGQAVTARRAGDHTLIPLPGNADPNTPVEVSLRLGKPAQDPRVASLALPIVFSPVLTTQWNVKADANHLLIPTGGSVESSVPVLWPNGFDWLADRGLVPLASLAILIVAIGMIRSWPLRLLALALAVGVAGVATWDAFTHSVPTSPLQLRLPVLAARQSVSLEVGNVPRWRAAISWPGVAILIFGSLLVLQAWRTRATKAGWLAHWIALGMIATGVLLQSNGAVSFFGLLTLAILIYPFLPAAMRWSKLSLLIGSVLVCLPSPMMAAEPEDGLTMSNELEPVLSANRLTQKWTVSSREKRLTASAEIGLAGRPGDRFVLLRSPAVLTQFQGAGLRLSKLEIPNQGVMYVVTIAANENEEADRGADGKPMEDHSMRDTLGQYRASFEFQLEAIQCSAGIPVLTGSAALQQIDLSYDEANWEVVCETAARIESQSTEGREGATAGRATILLGPGPNRILLRPQARDLNTEATQFFVEGAGLYTPSPGVIDGKNRFKIRTSQGRVQQLRLVVPTGQTVSSVEGPIRSWQFDAETSRLQLQVAPATPADFLVTVETQRGLDALPTSVQLSPLRVENAAGEVGLIALAFGSEAQPESVQAESFSLVNLSDFDAGFLTNPQSTLHRVYRYGLDDGSLAVRVSPVAPEIRLVSKQVVSFGDERVVLGVQFVTEVSRTGLFQLSFALPSGLEVESLTGEALHHWSEITENGQRQIVLHLKSKTLGTQKFLLTLAGAAPTDAAQWSIPRFELNEAERQSGELVVQPTTGIRLRTIARQNVSEADPRSLGATGQGALAFRLLQREWSLQLGVEKLAPWVTGQVLHDVTLREGQTRSIVLAEFDVQNAAIRTLSVKLPAMEPHEIKTLRASGETVSDFVRSTQEENVWELRFKRRVIGPVRFQLEYERRGQRESGTESLQPMDFPDAKQLGYHYAVRTGGRLEMEPGEMTQGWQRSDWSAVPQPLREAGNRTAPALSLRAMAPTKPMSLRATRHALADALKLRVTSGTLTTVLSPTGDQLTAVDMEMEVIQRSSLSVQLPAGGELFSIFVNGESIHSIRQQAGKNTWQFYILPGLDDRTAQVRFVYSRAGGSLSKLSLISPQLNVPLENIEWNVVAPSGLALTDRKGNLELIGQVSLAEYDRTTYLSSLKGKRQDQAQQAAKLLEQANQLLQSGEQSKAQWAFNNVANRHALDAASNEDARVQLENLQMQQAVVGLNTRRQRLFLDNHRGGEAVSNNEQLRQAASTNPILQQEQLNYRPQDLSQLLAGNSKEDNAILQRIAGRLVLHQRTTESAPQAILITLPEEGNTYRFRRSLQVAENTPLELQLQFNSQYGLHAWQWLVFAGLVGLLAAGLVSQGRSPLFGFERAEGNVGKRHG